MTYDPGALSLRRPDLIRVAVVDDAELTRLGLRAMASVASDMTLVGEAATASEALAVSRRFGPDVVLVAVDADGFDGPGLIRQLGQACPEVGIVAMSSTDGDEPVHQAARAGAKGFVLTSMPVAEIAAGIRAVSAGRRSFPAIALERLAERQGQRELTPRERQVLVLLAEGWGNAKIAANLNIAAGTVKIHVRAILAKLGADDRTEAAAFAWRRGFVHAMSARFEPTLLRHSA